MGITLLMIGIYLGTPVETQGVAVVELFTSEGCSSCPPADQLLEDLHRENRDGVFLLSFHVAYWDYLGWRDPYSSKDYGQRQRQYARALQSDRVYTPQMIVNGTDAFVGSDRPKAKAAISRALSQPMPLKIELGVIQLREADLSVPYKVRGKLPPGSTINLVLVDSPPASRVRRGENAGRTLRHVNVVRNLVTLPATHAGSQTLELPKNLDRDSAEVLIFLQDGDTRQVIGASSKKVQIDWP